MPTTLGIFLPNAKKHESKHFTSGMQCIIIVFGWFVGAGNEHWLCTPLLTYLNSESIFIWLKKNLFLITSKQKSVKHSIHPRKSNQSMQRLTWSLLDQDCHLRIWPLCLSLPHSIIASKKGAEEELHTALWALWRKAMIKMKTAYPGKVTVQCSFLGI